MENNRAKALLDKYNNGLCSPEEKAIVESWFTGLSPEEQKELTQADYDLAKMQLWANIQSNIQPAPIRKLWPRIAAVAASVLIVISTVTYVVIHKQAATQKLAQNHDIAPGHDQATLTLANGKKILLTKGMSGKLAQQGNTEVQVKTNQGITYTTSRQADHALTEASYNTLTTKRGESSPYPLVLPDGSKVWLNAASSITFPTAFNGKQRIVSVTGEAIMEVKHDPAHSFIVKGEHLSLKDIGTTFDVNFYDDEPEAKVTLIEGSVSVSSGKRETILKPGQQAASQNNGIKSNNITVSNANLESVLAWKSGKFDFSNADVQTVMRQIARWYNVDVEYEGGIPTAAVTGGVFRNTNASNALKIVKLLGIPYRIEGRKIIITNTNAK